MIRFDVRVHAVCHTGNTVFLRKSKVPGVAAVLGVFFLTRSMQMLYVLWAWACINSM